jgi:arylsulfatase
MEGVSLKPLLDGTRIERPQPLFWEHEGNRAIRTGQWKLVSKHPGGWELYDMSADRTEAENLAETMPDRIRELKMLWEARAAKVGIAPWQVLSSERGKPGQ